MIKLTNLFEKLEPWLQEVNEFALYNEPYKDADNKYYYLYCWVNLDTQWCYIGVHKSCNAYNEEGYLGTSGSPHYWNSRKIHEYKCIILGYYASELELLTKESELVTQDFIDKYQEKGLFNIKPGGKGGWSSTDRELGIKNARKKLLELYPNTNGVPPQAIKAWNEAGLKKLKELYPDTNGAPVQWNEAGLKKLKELYPDTNGVPPQATKAWNEAGLIAAHLPEVREKARNTCVERYGSTTGFMNTGEATINRLESNRNNHGGVLAWHTKDARDKGFNTKIELYGNPMGMCHTESANNKRMITKSKLYNDDPHGQIHTKEAYENSRRIQFINAFDSFKISINNALSDLSSDFIFNKEIYYKYKIPGSPNYKPKDIRYIFDRCIEYNIDLDEVTNLSKHFRCDWIPPRLWNYSNDVLDYISENLLVKTYINSVTPLIILLQIRYIIHKSSNYLNNDEFILDENLYNKFYVKWVPEFNSEDMINNLNNILNNNYIISNLNYLTEILNYVVNHLPCNMIPDYTYDIINKGNTISKL